MINANVIELISNLGHIVSANDDVMKKFKIFIQTVLCNGKSKDTCVEIRVRMYNKQNKRTQSHFIRTLCHANKLFVEGVISRTIGCIVQIKFSLNFR